MASSLWTMISGDFSACPSVGKERNIHFSVFGHPSSYINHVMVFSVDILLMFTSLLAFIFKPSSAASQVPTVFHSSSSLQILSATFNGILGLAYLVLGFLILGENLKNARTIQPLLWWSVPLFHGCTWISLGLIISFKGRRLNKILASIFSLLASIFTVYLSVSSLFAVIFKHKQVSVEIVLYVLLLPGIILMLLSIFKATKKSESSQIVDETSLYTPLNSETDESKESSLDNNNVSPLGKAGLLSRLSFWWLNPLMVKGKEKTLQDEDIPHLPKLARAETCYLLFMEQLNKCTQNQPSNTASMLSVIVSCHWREILISGHFALLSVLMLCSGPLFLNAFIQVAQGNEAFRHEGYALAAGFFIAKCTESMSERQWYFRTRLIGVQIRSLLSAVIYQKQLRLSNAAKMAHSASDIMNYDAVDAYRIGEFPYWMHQTWTTIVQFCISLVILFRAVGLATISALVVVILSVIFNAPLAKLQHRHQKKLIEAQAERLKATSEALVNMKVLKLYAWENHWKNSIEELRKIEYKCLVSYMLRRASSIIIFWSTPMLVSAATFGTCCFLGIPLNASNVFTVLVTLRLVQEPIRIFPDVFEAAIHASVALSRILNFLEASELQVRPKCGEELNYSIFVKSANFSWENNNLKPTLRNINLETKPGEKIAICGEVGSGKSTLLAGILGEVPNVDGRVYVHGEIAYVSQTAWIQTGTIQENVLFGSPMNEKRYQETIEKCALVKDLEMLPSGDLTEIGERGANLSGGQKQRIQLARALYQNADIYLLDDPFSAVDAHTAAYLFSEYVMGALSQKTVLLVTHQLDFLPPFDSVLLLLEGKILEVAPYHQLLASNKAFQGLVYAHHNRGGSKSLTEISSAQRETASEGEINRIHYKEQLKASEGDRLIMNEERETGDVGLKPYIEYLNQNKGFLYFLVMNLAHLIFTFGQILQNSWMAVKVQDPHFSGWRLVTVFFLIGCCSIFFLIFRSIFVVILGVQSSKSLFSQLLNSLIRAPMSFYDSTPLGRIYSRVSSDLSIVDLDIPFSLTFAVGAAITTYSNLGVLIVLTWQALLVIVFMIYVTILLQRYYQASAKELMRINGTSKSFVTNHLAESIAGATTIRAFKEEERFFTKYLDLVDNNASPYLHSFAANEWFIQRLEMLCAIVVSSSALVIVLLPPNTLGSGLIGMALSYGLSLNVFVVFYMQHQCRLSNYIISVERLAQYMHIPSEAPEVIESNRPFRSWPTLGRVEFYDLKVRYRPKAPLVLHGINCTFEGGQKIGIVGRTGSGKTTLISALFRLVEPTSGTVIIDGIDICTLGLHDLRSHLGIIPQDPTLFHGSVRYNLDPLSHHTDQEIWEVLAKCQLREIVQEKEEGLDSLVVEDGSNWSKGQRQLFALGRALLRRSRILVLDEATASVDNATDSILQKSVRTEFADCTVVMVAHRIPTVMDCTMVLSMSDGKLVEFDEPRKLMQKEGSLFRQLVREYWSHTTDFSVSSSSIT